jgi:phosphoserine phosphatase
MAELSPARIEQKRIRLLTKVRDGAVDLANGADRHGDYVAVDTWAFDALIQRINRLMAFEDHYAEA